MLRHREVDRIIADATNQRKSHKQSKYLGAYGRMNMTMADVLCEYDWVLVTERFDESLVVLKMLLHLELREVAYLHPSKHVVYKVPDVPAEAVNAFKSNPWFEDDVELFNLAVRRLEQQIQLLQLHGFAAELARFREFQQGIHRVCEDPASYTEEHYPGEPVCRWSDGGCGFHCIDDFARNHSHPTA